MKKYFLIIIALAGLPWLFWPFSQAAAMPLGTLLYRTSSDGKIYGYSDFELLKINNGILSDLYTGHVGIYVGQENGVDYVVEALANGVVKTPAKDFVDLRNGEKLIGARLPIKATPTERATAVILAKTIAESAPAYDFDFHTQKGPGSGQWICSGLAEKVYESADAANPYDLSALQYDPGKYGVDITPDGFDNDHVVNAEGDVLALSKEFSKIAPRVQMLLPATEAFGFNAGFEHAGQRYFFLPFTQFSQPSLKSVAPDIILASDFKDEEIRGKQPTLSLVFKWSLVNNPLSSVRLLAKKISDHFFPAPAIAVNQPAAPSPASSLVATSINTSTPLDWEKLFPNPQEKIISALNSAVKAVKKKKTATAVSSRYDNEPELDRVIDGDTIVLKDGRKVRYLDINAPEIASASRKTTECRGLEAKALNEQILSAGKLILVPDSLAKKDVYSRWLFYVYVLKKDGTVIFVNQALVESGLADPDFCPANKPSCPEAGDEVRRQIIEEAGTRSQAERAGFLADCAAAKVAAKEVAKEEKKASSTPIVKELNTATTTSKIVKTKATTAKKTTSTAESAGTASGGGGNSAGSVSPPVASASTSTIPDTNNSSATSSASSSPVILLPPLITKIFGSDDNRWLELYNPNDQPFDLASSTFRLEKAKTALDPSIMLRFSEAADIKYNSGSLISPRGNFLIASNKADESWRTQANALALNSGFTWGKSGYTFYSGTNAISSPDDSDIVEKIGFGPDATYFSATSAPALLDGSYLGRKKLVDGSFSATGNNALDFQLFPLSNLTATTSDASASSSAATTTETTASSTATSTVVVSTAINSPGLTDVWHFDDCAGGSAQDSLSAGNSLILPSNYLFDFGKNGCALKLTDSNTPASVTLATSSSLDQASIVFYYLAQPGASLSFLLNHFSGEAWQIDLRENGLQYSGAGFSGTSSLAIISDNAWHQVALSFDSQSQAVILYQDGQEISRFTYSSSWSLADFSVAGNNILLDELALWRRTVSSAELASFFQIGRPFYTADLYNSSASPQKAYYWHLGGVDSQFSYNTPKYQSLPAGFMPRDFSYDFWWRNSSYPNDGRIVAALLSGDDGWLVASVISLWYSRWNFGTQGGLLYGNDPFIPQDANWHLFTLTYSSQDMMARWYIDGQEVFSKLAVWLKRPVQKIMIQAENYPFELSDFSLWEGALSQEAISQIWAAGRPFSGS